MDRELIERLTDEAVAKVGRGPAWRLVFARLIAEECAKVAENYAAACEDQSPYGASAAKDIADNIREKFSA